MAYLLGVLGEPGSVMTEVVYRADWYWDAFQDCLTSDSSQAGALPGCASSRVHGHAARPCKHRRAYLTQPCNLTELHHLQKQPLSMVQALLQRGCRPKLT